MAAFWLYPGQEVGGRRGRGREAGGEGKEESEVERSGGREGEIYSVYSSKSLIPNSQFL